MLWITVTVSGCGEKKPFDIELPPSQVNIYKWESEEHIGTISDQGKIDTLVNDLHKSRSSSTANMDFALPDYLLVFLHGERTVLQVGYYTEIQDLGVEGRYWWKDRMYNLKTELSSITKLEEMSNE
ncbi:hypothetical protein H0266_02540 [Halobacillus locisalis]|uniref:Uncharacterized protein n=1 Tax=Halobacillus locisalis TaxID=220753 RepID=A0A838CPI6_9BACI|nr:hypothetical protein [Halobacillus locisalis]MBA2173768.1 hypothetical protein [Halobacillus locisalis]